MIFISYSNQNGKEMELFRRVCAPVARRHNEVFWTDRDLGAGDWEKQIDD